MNPWRMLVISFGTSPSSGRLRGAQLRRAARSYQATVKAALVSVDEADIVLLARPMVMHPSVRLGMADEFDLIGEQVPGFELREGVIIEDRLGSDALERLTTDESWDTWVGVVSMFAAHALERPGLSVCDPAALAAARQVGEVLLETADANRLVQGVLPTPEAAAAIGAQSVALQFASSILPGIAHAPLEVVMELRHHTAEQRRALLDLLQDQSTDAQNIRTDADLRLFLDAQLVDLQRSYDDLHEAIESTKLAAVVRDLQTDLAAGGYVLTASLVASLAGPSEAIYALAAGAGAEAVRITAERIRRAQKASRELRRTPALSWLHALALDLRRSGA